MPDQSVLSWWQEQPPYRLYTTTITRAELLYGVEILPEGRRKTLTHSALLAVLSKGLQSRILGFDEAASEAYAQIAAFRKSIGKPIDAFDGCIAAIAKSHNAKLATRNVKDFVNCGIEVVNPWEFHRALPEKQ